jgi:hypothetical protein
VLNNAIDQEVVIDSTSAPNYKSWQTNVEGPGANTKAHFDVYFFDVQNPEGVKNGERPVVVEKGPYAYKEYFNKFDISWHDDGDLVTFNTQKYYIFDEERTLPGLSEFDNLTLVNPTVAALRYDLNAIPANVSLAIQKAIIELVYVEYTNLEQQLQDAYNQIDNDKRIPPKVKEKLESEVRSIDASLTKFYDDLESFVESSSPVTLIMKVLLCGSPYGVSPFFTKNPSPAYFGWLNDPLLLEVQHIIDDLGISYPWSSR